MKVENSFKEAVVQNRQGGNQRGGNRGGGNQPPQQQGGGGTPPAEPNWADLYADLALAANGVMEFPDRIVNMTTPRIQLIAALAVVEKKLGITGSLVTNANAEERVGNAVSGLATWEPHEEEENHGGGQVARPTPTRPRGPQGGTPAHPTPPTGGQRKKPGFWDGFWGRDSSNQGGHH